MKPFDSARRDLLKLSSAGLAASAAAAFPAALAAAPRKLPEPMLSPVLFDVRAFGATGDGKTVDSPAINKAIEAAAAAGGGTVVFPAGNYVSFSIRLKSHVDLYLTSACTIIAAESPLPGQTTGYMGGTYDAADEPHTDWVQYQDWGHNHWHNSLLWGDGISDFSITGPGLLWGKGLSFGADRPARGGYPKYVAEQAGVGNKAIGLRNCRNVVLRDFSILKGGHFGMLLTGVDNLTIDNLKIDTDRDGMDIDCCRNVRVTGCFVNAPWDDGICPKSSLALGYARPTEKVTISDCYVSGCWQLGTLLDGSYKRQSTGGGRIKCGTESNGGFLNFAITNCVFEGTQGIALESADGATLEDFTISNITMRDITSCPIFMRLGARLRGPADSTKVGTLRRVLISNLNCYNTAARFGSILSGIPGYFVEDVKLGNIYVQNAGGGDPSLVDVKPAEDVPKYPEPGMFGPTPSHGFYLRHVNRVELSHVEVHPAKPDPRPAFYLDDVHRADFIAVTAPTAPPAFSIHNSSDVRILISRAAPDSTTP